MKKYVRIFAIGSVAILYSLATVVGQNEKADFTLEASGSFYETGDYFSVAIDVYKDRAVAQWNGFIGTPWEFRGDKDNPEARVKKTVEWKNPKVIASLRTLHANLEFSRIPQMAIGQGLSIGVDASPRPAGMAKELFFFATDPEHWQSAEMQRLWRSSQSIATGEAEEFLKQVDKLATKFGAYRKRRDQLTAALSQEEEEFDAGSFVKLLRGDAVAAGGKEIRKLDQVAAEILSVCLSAEGVEKLLGRSVDLSQVAFVLESDRVVRLMGAFLGGESKSTNLRPPSKPVVPVAVIERESIELLLRSLGVAASNHWQYGIGMDQWAYDIFEDGDFICAVSEGSVGESRLDRLNAGGFCHALFLPAKVGGRRIYCLERARLSIKDEQWAEAKFEFIAGGKQFILPIQRASEGGWFLGALWEKREYEGEDDEYRGSHFRPIEAFPKKTLGLDR